ncbi:glycosyltransferase family 4 protein [Actinospongicola halichondriae]|uniref:glycosyltransferase family 4 protein n=1 Tax=Actinospongicola halichondriae TaxID=3236844 RepID=UPI003D4E70D5
MRIAFVTMQYPPRTIGGIGTYVQVVARVLVDAGHEVTVVCIDGADAASTAVEDGVTVLRAPSMGPDRLRRWMRAPGKALRTRVHGAVSAALVMRRLRREFDVVECPEWKAQGLLVGPATALPVVVHAHLALDLQHAWNEVEGTRGARIAGRAEQASARRAAAITATSRQTTRYPDGERWIPDDAVDLVAPPMDAGLWADCAPVAESDPVVVFVGRLERRKAPEVLVEALATLQPAVPGLRVVFAGASTQFAGGSYAERVVDRAAELGLPCELLGSVADPERMREVYGAARVVAVPSRFETLSMVVFEALASGRPAVMTDQVGAAEWIGPGLPDLVVPADDVAALAAALRPHLVDADHAARVGALGRSLVAEVCAPETVASSRTAVYERVIGQTAAGR